MKKILLLFYLSFGALGFGQTCTTPINFGGNTILQQFFENPDNYTENRIRDINGDPLNFTDLVIGGVVCADNADLVHYLNLAGGTNDPAGSGGFPGVNLTSLQGIEFFTNLESLFAQGNNLTELDLTQNTNLITVRAFNQGGAGITNLDLTGLTALDLLGLGINSIANGDFSTNSSLRVLDVQRNSLISISLHPNAPLVNLVLNDNNLTTLDISNNDTNLTTFRVQDNPNLTCIKVSDLALPTNNIPGNWIVDGNDTSIFTTNNCTGCQTVTVSLSLEAFLEAEVPGTLLDAGGNNVIGFSDGPNANGRVCQNAVDQVATIDAEVPGAGVIADFSGIASFINLQNLEASANTLTETIVDLSSNSNLITVDLRDTQLSQIVLPNGSPLTQLDVAENNNLTSIDLSGSLSLESFFAFESGLQGNLDLASNNNLGLLGVENCNITNITWPTASSLFKLSLRGNQLMELDLRTIDSRTIDVLLTCGNPLTCIQVNDIVDANTKLETDLINGTQCPPRSLAYPNEDPDGDIEWRIDENVFFTTENSCTVPPSPDDFIITVRTDNPGVSNDNQFLLPLEANENYNFDIDWENDGIIDDTAVTGQLPAHTYPAPGSYTIVIKDNSGNGSGFPRIFFNDPDITNSSDSQKVTSIDQWGTGVWTSMNGAFAGCSNMVLNTTDVPDLSGVSDMTLMFHSCTSFNGAIGNWDVSNITTTTFMFGSATIFNADISNWDMSSLIQARGMFLDATSFNADIGNWNLQNAQNLSKMLENTSSFNQNLGNWNITNVTNMTEMLNNSGLNLANYDSTLIGWAAQTVQDNITLGATGLNFCDSEMERQNLIDTNGWTFDGDSRDLNCDNSLPTIEWGTITSTIEGQAVNQPVVIVNGEVMVGNNLEVVFELATGGTAQPRLSGLNDIEDDYIFVSGGEPPVSYPFEVSPGIYGADNPIDYGLLTILDDTRFEANETIRIEIRTADFEIIGDSILEYTIIDDDYRVSIQGNGDLDENGGTSSFTFTLEDESGNPVINESGNDIAINFLDNGEALQGTDYDTSGNAIIPNGDGQGQLIITGLDDFLYEGEDELIDLEVQVGEGYFVDEFMLPSAAIGINDNDNNVNITMTQIGFEGQDNVQVTISLSDSNQATATNASGATIGFDILLESGVAPDAAVLGADFIGGILDVTGNTVFIDNNESEISFEIEVVDDDEFEELENFRVVVEGTTDDILEFIVNFVSAEIQDNENIAPDIIIDPSTGLQTSEDGTTADFTVVLQSQPTTDVVLNLTVLAASADEISLDQTTLTFTSINWNEPQIVTITGQDDTEVDGDQDFQIDVSVDVDLSDDIYDTVATVSVNGINADNDSEVDNTIPDVSVDTFTVTILENSCLGQSDGEIQLQVNNTSDTFNVAFDGQSQGAIAQGGSLNFPNLEPGDYTLLLTSPAFNGWQQEFKIELTGVTPITIPGFSIDQINVLAKLQLEGSESYTIDINGKEVFYDGFDATLPAYLEVSVEKGFNRMTLKGEKACQGLLQKDFIVGTVLAHPIPVDDRLFLEGLPSEEALSLQLFDLTGRLVGEWKVNDAPPNMPVNMGGFEQGMYVLKIFGKGYQENIQLLKN